MTRKERRNLLAFSALAIIVVHTGLIPAKLGGLGIEFAPLERSAFLKILAGAVAYFLLAFIIYAIADWLSGRWDLELALRAERDEMVSVLREDLIQRSSGTKAGDAIADAIQEARDTFANHFEQSHRRLQRATTPIVATRWIFEFAVPVGVAVYALLGLARAW